MNIKTISGGYQVPDDECLGKFQIESDRLDHDRHLIPLVCEHIKPGMAVLDGGAFNGDHSIAYRIAAGEKGYVFSIEANPFTFDMLRHNMQMQIENTTLYERPDVAQSHCINAALGRDTGSILAKIEEKPNLGASHLERQMIVDKDSKTVPMVSIDWLRRIYKVKFSFIKLDIEGFELEALRGGLACLAVDRPTLLIEMCAETLKRQDADYGQIYAILRENRYSWKVCQPQLNEESEMYDLIATPEKL